MNGGKEKPNGAKEKLIGGGGAGAGKNADTRRALADLNAMD